MAESTTTTIFVIKNGDGQYLEYQSYNGLRTWANGFSDRCAFPTQNVATLYCRNLIADAESHGVNMEFDVYKHNNTVTKTNVTIADSQRVSYGLPEKVVEETTSEE